MTRFPSFDERGREHPCSGCPAPCCRLQLHPMPTPVTAADLDVARYRLLAPASEIAIDRDHTWTVVRWMTCTLFDDARWACSAHGTPRKPRVCEEFDAWSCWFKRNFADEEPIDVVRFDREQFEGLMQAVRVAENGEIEEWPPFAELRQLAGPRADAPAT